MAQWRRALAAAVISLLVAGGAVLGMTGAMAYASDSNEDVSPEQYPAPSEPEKSVEPKPPVEQSLPKTGAPVSWPLLAAGGAGLILVGGTLLVIRRRQED